MRAVVQRVSRSTVTVDGQVVGRIGRGQLVLLGVSVDDGKAEAEYLVGKVVNLRVFDDSDGKMNLSLADIDGDMLVVSQFTLYGDTRRGRRPSFIRAAGGETASALYEHFVAKARESVNRVETGVFGAMMNVELVNDGPVTIILDTEQSE